MFMFMLFLSIYIFLFLQYNAAYIKTERV
jgi:hypothetical protein